MVFFGLFKLKLKNSEVDDLEDLVDVVESSTNGYNKVQTIYDKNGERKVFFYRWAEHLRKFFKPLPYILKYHHFIFNQKEPGIVHVKESIDGELKAIDITKDLTINAVLEERHPLGLRQSIYLKISFSMFKILTKKLSFYHEFILLFYLYLYFIILFYIINIIFYY